MKRRFFDRKPGHQAAIFAEAQSLLDDGLDSDFVLGLYPDEADWLGPMLETAEAAAAAIGSEQPTYYFEASLKAKFLAAADEASRPEPVAPMARARVALAGATVIVGAAMVGVVTLGFATSEDAVPGDWNYSFKLANERLQYSLSHGDGRVDVQVRQAEARVRELQTVTVHGNVSATDIERLERTAGEISQQLANVSEIDEDTRLRLKDFVENSLAVLADAKAKNPSLAAAVGNAETAITGVGVAAGITGTPSALQTPEPTPTPTVRPTAESSTPAATGTPTPEPTPTPLPSGTAAPAESPSPGASPTQ